MKITDLERETIRQWAGEQHRPLKLELAATDHPGTEPLRSFCRTLTNACDALQVSDVATAGEEFPALCLRQGAILYRAAPLDSELEPFLEALAGKNEDSGAGSGPFRAAALRLFVAATCPHCPTAVRSLLPLIVAGGPVTLEVIDSEAFSELTEAQGVKSVPTLILDQTFRWTGTIRPGDLEELLAPGDRTGISAGVLQNLLEGGNAGPLTELMVEAGVASPALCRLMASDALSVRLGAMMVVEELLEQSPGLVAPLIPELWKRFSDAPEPARGDMLYIFGEAGTPALARDIDTLLATDLHPEVAEAARDALERLAERHGPA